MADYKDISQIAVSIEASGYADEIIAEGLYCLVSQLGNNVTISETRVSGTYR